MRRTIQGLWIGPSLSLIEQLCIRSFLDHGHEFHLYAYEPVENVPSGTTVLDANEILPEEKIFRSKTGGLRQFSNFFRWTLLTRKGGVWADMDVICLKPFDFGEEPVFAVEAPNGSVGNSVLSFPAGHFLATVMKEACEDVNKFQPIDKATTRVKKVFRSVVYGKEKSRAHVNFGEPGGPGYFTKQLKHHGLYDQAAPQHWFYPFAFNEWRQIYEPVDAVEDAIKESYAIHLWNAILTSDETVDKDERNLDGTLIGALLDRHFPKG